MKLMNAWIETIQTLYLIVLFDLKKAFDTCNFDILLKKTSILYERE